jgi:hypothetical protein
LTEYRLLVDGRDVSAVRVAASYPARLRGLLGTSAASAVPLVLSPGNSVHGWGMTYPLDVAQLSGSLERSGGSLRVERLAVLRPWGFVAARRGVRYVLEAPRHAFGAWGLAAGSGVRIQRASLETTVENGDEGFSKGR